MKPTEIFNSICTFIFGKLCERFNLPEEWKSKDKGFGFGAPRPRWSSHRSHAWAQPHPTTTPPKCPISLFLPQSLLPPFLTLHVYGSNKEITTTLFSYTSPPHRAYNSILCLFPPDKISRRASLMFFFLFWFNFFFCRRKRRKPNSGNK